MTQRVKKAAKPAIILLLLLLIVFFVRLAGLISKNIDHSRIFVRLLSDELVSVFTPELEYIYWGESNAFLDHLVHLFFPAGRLIYEESANSANTMPSEYLVYYQAIRQSESTGAAKAAPEETALPVSAVSTEFTPGTITPLYSRQQLSDYNFLLNEFYTVDRTTYADASLLNAESLLAADQTIDKDTQTILIYHTHSQEAFADSTEGDSSMSIVAVGDYLARCLSERYGFQVIHNTEVYDLQNGLLDRSKAYIYAEKSIASILKEHPEIDVIIDLHRDGIDGEKMTTELGGKTCARLMLFNGLSRTVENGEIDYLYNPNLAGNLSFSFQTQLAANQKYPGLMRHIYLKGYEYNLHFLPKCMLIEAGSQKNSFQEMLNAMEPLADVLNDVLTRPPSLN